MAISNSRSTSPFRLLTGWFELLLCKCSGARMDVLKMDVCESERPKFARLGISVLIPTTIALSSAAYAAWTVCHYTPISVFVGCIGGLVVFNTDRILVGESRKRKGEGVGAQVRLIAIRLSLSLFMSYVISEPFIILIFKGPIDVYLNDKNQAAAIQFEEKIKAKFTDIPIFKNKINSLEKSLDSGEENRDRAYADMMSECTGEKGSGKTGKFGDGVFCKKRQQELSKKEREYKDLKSKIEGEISENKQKLATLENRAQKERDSAQKFREDANTLPTQISALDEISQTNGVIRIKSIAYMLMLVAIEIAPILSKTFSPPGLYDAILNGVEEDAIQYQEGLSDNRKHLTGIKLLQQRNRQERLLLNEEERFTALEATAHENLLNAIDQIQETALSSPEWQEAIDRAVSTYVNTLSRQMEEYANSFYLSKADFDRRIRPLFVKKAEQYASTVAEDGFKKRNVHNVMESILNQLGNIFKRSKDE